MIVLGQLPCLWIATDPPPPTALYRMNRYLWNYFRIAPGDSQAMARFLQRETAEHVLILDAEVLPGSSLPLYIPDPLLLESGRCFRLLSRNSVTRGFDNRHGPLICSRDSLLSNLVIPPPEAVVPVALCNWQCNETPERAFSAAFQTVSALPQGEAAVAACTGADVPHGLSWLLGGLSALGGSGDLSAAWSRENVVLGEPDVAWRRIVALARELRLDHGLDLWPLDAAQSRLAKAVSGDYPPARLFHDIAAFYDGLGKDGAITAARYRTAAQ
jgi:hypothetical protein